MPWYYLELSMEDKANKICSLIVENPDRIFSPCLPLGWNDQTLLVQILCLWFYRFGFQTPRVLVHLFYKLELTSLAHGCCFWESVYAKPTLTNTATTNSPLFYRGLLLLDSTPGLISNAFGSRLSKRDE